jgi:hypothetical protein
VNWRPEGETVHLGNRTIVYLPGLPWEDIDHAFVDDGAHLTIPRGSRLTEEDLRRLDEQRAKEAEEDQAMAGERVVAPTPHFAGASGGAARPQPASRWRYRCQTVAATAGEDSAAFLDRLTGELNRLSDDGWELAALRDDPLAERGPATLLILRQRREA